MPLYKSLKWKNSELVIWKFDENEPLHDLILSEDDLAKIENYHPKKRSEFLMIRRILNEKLPGEKIIYDENGQPLLANSNLKISISHSFPLAGIAFSDQEIGFDVEPVREKIIRVKHKFIFDEEQNFIPKNQKAEYLTVIWSVKEALYKIHHAKHWSLKRHYEVRPFSLDDDEILCRIYDEASSEEFVARFWIDDGFVVSAVSSR